MITKPQKLLKKQKFKRKNNVSFNFDDAGYVYIWELNGVLIYLGKLDND